MVLIFINFKYTSLFIARGNNYIHEETKPSTPLCSLKKCVYILTIKNYAGVSDPHRVHGNAGVVSIVFFRHVEEDEQRLFVLSLYFKAVYSIQQPAK